MGFFVKLQKLRHTPRGMRSGLSRPDLEMRSVFGNAAMAKAIQGRLRLSGSESATEQARYALTHRIDAADWQPEPEGIPSVTDLWNDDSFQVVESEGRLRELGELIDPSEGFIDHVIDQRVRSIIGNGPLLVPTRDPSVFVLGEDFAAFLSELVRELFNSQLPVRDIKIVFGNDIGHEAGFRPGAVAQASGATGTVLLDLDIVKQLNSAQLAALLAHEIAGHGVQFEDPLQYQDAADARHVAEEWTMSRKEQYRVWPADNASPIRPLDANAGHSLESVPQRVARAVWVRLGLDKPEWAKSTPGWRLGIE